MHRIEKDEQMRAPYTELYLHCVWATWDRLPLISSDVEPRLYSAIAAKCRELKCEPVSINGVSDHVHILVRLATTITIADLLKAVKGSSSHLMTHEIVPGEFFRWQGAYGAFTVGKRDVDRIAEYVDRRKARHAEGGLWDDWERCLLPGAD
jgi:putative transposase